MARARENANRRPRRSRRTAKSGYFDFGLLFIIIFLIAFGLVMLYSVSYYTAQTSFGDPLFYVKQQIVGVAVGAAGMFFTAKIFNYHWYEKVMSLVYIVPLLCNILLFTGLGQNYSGSTRWLKLGPLSFQPSELTKIAVIILVAYFISSRPKLVQTIKGLVFVLGALVGIQVAPVALSNLSTAIIIAGIGVGMLFVACRDSKYFWVIAAILLIAGVMLVVLFPYRFERIKVWRAPELYDNGYQTLQGLYAIGSGGLFGKGLGQSVQKLTAVPEPENDMIFSIICEELGLVGAIAVILLFLMLIYKLLFIAINAQDLFGSMLAIGIMIHIALQVVLNIAVVTNTIPNTGVTLPFISYGKTSLAILMTELGIALNVSRGIKIDNLEVTQHGQN